MGVIGGDEGVMGWWGVMMRGGGGCDGGYEG